MREGATLSPRRPSAHKETDAETRIGSSQILPRIVLIFIREHATAATSPPPPGSVVEWRSARSDSEMRAYLEMSDESLYGSVMRAPLLEMRAEDSRR
jgi:hypothetical protein